MPKQNSPPTLISKIQDSILILLISTTTPYILSLFRFPITKNHYLILTLLTITSILIIFSSSSQQSIIQQVFEAKQIEINGQYPKLLKSKGEKSND